MAEQQTFFNWQKALSDTYSVIIQGLNDYFPQLVGAVAILLLGIISAYLLRLVARKLTLTIEGLIAHSTGQPDKESSQGKSYSTLVGNLVFWSILLFFMAASANLLDWEIFSAFLSSLIAYLPQLFAGLLIILAGFALAGVVRSLMETAMTSAGIARPEVPATIVQATVVMTALVIGIEQFGINVTFVTTSIIVVAGVLLFGAALAFGLGARHFVANLIGAQISARQYQIGQKIKLSNVEGHLLEITQTTLVLDTSNGRVVVPASLLQQQVSEIIIEEDQPGDGGSMIDKLFRKKDETNGPA